jgi:uroporphyrinogen-III synthase
MKTLVRIVSTKKLQTNQKQFLLNANFSVIEAEYIKIKLKKFSYKSNFQHLIFSSQNAVESLLKNSKLEQLRSKKCLCVGQKTKESLELNGFKVVECADYASELASIICNQYNEESFVFFSGNLRKEILPEALKLANVRFEEIEVYETILTPQTLTAKPDGILFFSPSAVESYLQANTITDEICFCIGKTTAEPVEKITSNCIIANQPSIENVIIQCINYYQKSN